MRGRLQFPGLRQHSLIIPILEAEPLLPQSVQFLFDARYPSTQLGFAINQRSTADTQPKSPSVIDAALVVHEDSFSGPFLCQYDSLRLTGIQVSGRSNLDCPRLIRDRLQGEPRS